MGSGASTFNDVIKSASCEDLAAELRGLGAEDIARVKAAMASCEREISEASMLATLKEYKPEVKEGVAEKFIPPPFPKPDASDEEKAAVAEKKKIYDANIEQAFHAVAAGEDSDIYLALQPIFDMTKEKYKLVGLEVLARVKNGTDAAPMPGMAQWQVRDREGAMKFLKKQFDFALENSRKFPGVDINVNVRPDELAGARDKILEVSVAPSSIVVEITEYSPITEEVIAMITEMKGQGVRFALDDVTKVVDNPANGYAKVGTHSCSFELAKKHAKLFEVQKLSLPLCACAWRVHVYPTPQYADGKPVPYLAKQIIAHEEGESVPDAILERKNEIEGWVKEVRAKQPKTRFIIECSLHNDELAGKAGLIPDLKLFEEGCFAMQGGVFGGRCFPPEELVAAAVEAF